MFDKRLAILLSVPHHSIMKLSPRDPLDFVTLGLFPRFTHKISCLLSVQMKYQQKTNQASLCRKKVGQSELHLLWRRDAEKRIQGSWHRKTKKISGWRDFQKLGSRNSLLILISDEFIQLPILAQLPNCFSNFSMPSCLRRHDLNVKGLTTAFIDMPLDFQAPNWHLLLNSCVIPGQRI